MKIWINRLKTKRKRRARINRILIIPHLYDYLPFAEDKYT